MRGHWWVWPLSRPGADCDTQGSPSPPGQLHSCEHSDSCDTGERCGVAHGVVSCEM